MKHAINIENVHLHFHLEDGDGILKEAIHFFKHKLNTIMDTQKDIAQGINTLTTQVGKIGAESTKTLQKVTDLEAALANQDNVSPELQSAFDALKAQVQTVDDLIPDVATSPVTESPVTP